jgi:hypothetical protein
VPIRALQRIGTPFHGFAEANQWFDTLVLAVRTTFMAVAQAESRLPQIALRKHEVLPITALLSAGCKSGDVRALP